MDEFYNKFHYYICNHKDKVGVNSIEFVRYKYEIIIVKSKHAHALNNPERRILDVNLIWKIQEIQNNKMVDSKVSLGKTLQN